MATDKSNAFLREVQMLVIDFQRNLDLAIIRYVVEEYKEPDNDEPTSYTERYESAKRFAEMAIPHDIAWSKPNLEAFKDREPVDAKDDAD